MENMLTEGKCNIHAAFIYTVIDQVPCRPTSLLFSSRFIYFGLKVEVVTGVSDIKPRFKDFDLDLARKISK